MQLKRLRQAQQKIASVQAPNGHVPRYVMPPPLPPATSVRGHFDHPDMKLDCLDVWMRTPGAPSWSVRAFLQEGCDAFQLAPRYVHRIPPQRRVFLARNLRLKCDMRRVLRRQLCGPSMLKVDPRRCNPPPPQVDCSRVDS